jgi:hypothetical protein
MNSVQKKIVVVACLVLAGMAAYPPWVEESTRDRSSTGVIVKASGYAPIFDPPRGSFSEDWNYGFRVDTARLAAQWGIVLALSVAGVVAASGRIPKS